MTPAAFVTSLAAVFLAMAACTGTPAAEPAASATPVSPTAVSTSARADDTPAPPTAVSTSAGPVATPAPPREGSLERVVSASNEFGFNLFAELRKQDPDQNIFISPLSISTALAMTYNGAAGDTALAMAKTLRFGDLELHEVNRANAALLSALDDLNPQIEVKIANSLWGREDVQFREGFLERNHVHFGGEIVALDFRSPSAKDVINGWVEKSTEGEIDSIVDRIEKDDVLFLINAIYFNGEWKQPFREGGTFERGFQLLDGSKKRHPKMEQSGLYSYLETEGFQAVKLPYSKPQVGLYVFLPSVDSDLDNFLRIFDYGGWVSSMSSFSLKLGRIELPRFAFEFEPFLNEALIALGMGVAFDRERADLSGMRAAGPRLFIDRVKHKAVVEVNKTGTEAAAVTSVVIKEVSEIVTETVGGAKPFVFIADRPFFFAIRDDETGAILFMGALYEPME